MHILSDVLRILSIASLLLVLAGAVFVVGGIVSAVAGEFGAMLRTLFTGGLITLLGLATFVGFWILADRLKL